MDMKKINFIQMINFFNNKRVLITGNTGFKGSWLTKILLNAGAKVTGYSLQPPTEPGLFSISGVERCQNLKQIYGDVRDLENLKSAFKIYRPEIVLHLAAQPIVRESYRDPVNTFSTNVMGTVNVCECVRLSVIPYEKGGIKESRDSKECWEGVRSFLNVTTDKVYKNNEWEYGYRENDPLDGFDPYSNSKSCSELVTHSYRDSFFAENDIRVSTARAGNVIGGGDFSKDRIVPDCVRAMKDAADRKKDTAEIIVRNPYSTRPYQHVLEPLFAYLMIAMRQYEDAKYAGYYNVGPDDIDCVTTGDLVTYFCEKWNEDECSPIASWRNIAEKNAPHEASFLKLDCSRVRSVFGWSPVWHIGRAVEETVKFSKIWLECDRTGDYSWISQEMDREIEEYIR